MDSAKLEKQVNNKSDYNRNSNGVGGFGEHAENINRSGRPRNGQTWRDILTEVGETVVSQSHGKSFKEAVAVKLWEEALKGNINAMKILFERMDGIPKAVNVYKGEPEVQLQMERLKNLVDSLLEDCSEDDV